MKLILCDIEGTTTSIDFVHKTLFPYSRNKMEAYLQSHRQDKQIVTYLCDIYSEVTQQKATELTEQVFQTSLQNLLLWIDQDKKHPLLKKIQGAIWETGYLANEIQSHIYPDVKPQFEKWLALGYQIGIYSSGSVQAQKLLFKYTSEGNLLSYLTCFFDTDMGGKKESQSYLNIANAVQLFPSEICFISDSFEEIVAAQKADFKVILIDRTNTLKQPTGYNFTHSFENIQIGF